MSLLQVVFGCLLFCLFSFALFIVYFDFVGAVVVYFCLFVFLDAVNKTTVSSLDPIALTPKKVLERQV